MKKIYLFLLSALSVMMFSCGDNEPNNYRINRDPVDLGLSVKWAPMNIGAATPQAMGVLYGWADSTGLHEPINSEYPVAISYKMLEGREITIVDWRSPYFGGRSPLDNISGTDYDIARYMWNTEWRMPTTEEWQELIDRCMWTPVSDMEGATGTVFRVTGPNGNSIIIPLGGINTTNVNEARGVEGHYWTSRLLPLSQQAQYNYQSTVPCAAWSVKVTREGNIITEPQVRCFQLSVRPVLAE